MCFIIYPDDVCVCVDLLCTVCLIHEFEFQKRLYVPFELAAGVWLCDLSTSSLFSVNLTLRADILVPNEADFDASRSLVCSCIWKYEIYLMYFKLKRNKSNQISWPESSVFIRYLFLTVRNHFEVV